MPELTREAQQPSKPSRSALWWLGGGFAVLFGLAVLAVPALVCAGLLVRGVGEGHPSWVALGVTVGAMWSMMLVGTMRKTRSPKSARSDAPPPPDPARG